MAGSYCRSRSGASGAPRAHYATAVFNLLLNKYQNLAISIKYTRLWYVCINILLPILVGLQRVYRPLANEISPLIVYH